MKIEVNKGDLLGAINKVIGIVNPKSTTPLLECILFNINKEKNTMSLTGTDLSIVVQSSLFIRIIECEKDTVHFAVTAKLIHEILRNITDLDIELKYDDANLHIKTGKGNYKLSAHSGNDYPDLSKFQNSGLNDIEINIDGNELTGLINRVIYACSFDELRMALTGVFLEIDINSKEMILTGCDGHRLSTITKSNIGLKSEITEGFKYIIPKKTLDLLLKSYHKGNVGIAINKGIIKFLVPESGFAVSSNAIYGQYPKYRTTIPADHDKYIEINRNELAGMIRRVSLFSDEMTKSVLFKFEDNTVSVSASTENSDGIETIPTNWSYEKLMASYNSLYLQDMLKVLNSELVTFKLKDKKSPLFFDDLENNWKMLLMPIRLDEEN